MRSFILIFFVCIIFQNTASGKIKNGYSLYIDTVIKSLKSLRELAKRKDQNVMQNLRLREKINQHINYIFYFQQTEELLAQFHQIAPDLYNEIDSIMDRQGREIDVYVKMVLEKEIKFDVGGITNLDHVATDVDAYRSSYGDYSVSVKIRMLPLALTILAHEFGHIRYQVPNLAEYFKYYNQTYTNRFGLLNIIGHDADDHSGKSADAYVRLFRERYKNYLRAAGKKTNV